MAATLKSVLVQGNDWVDIGQALTEQGETIDNTLDYYVQNVGISRDGQPNSANVLITVASSKPEPFDFSACYSLTPNNAGNLGTLVAGDLGPGLKTYARALYGQHVFVNLGLS